MGEVEITLVLCPMKFDIGLNIISKLEDSCFIFYVKHQTDDLAILELAKNDSRNTWILSNDKFRDWLEKRPGEYDEIIWNRVIDDFGFTNGWSFGRKARYRFFCPNIDKM